MTMLPEYDSADATQMAAWVRDGEVSAIELTEAALERIEARNETLNAVVHLDADRARAAADHCADGPFRGVPFLLKDLGAHDAGQPSTSSCRPMEVWRAPADDTLVSRFKAGGVNVLGRTNTSEFGIYGVTEPEFRGICRNPWNPAHTPGGSSGGAGSAVAGRMVPMAHGGDGGGSIRVPAAHCGVFGLKPTRARNPVGPWLGEGWGGFVAYHVLTRSVRDSATMLDITRGPSPGDIYQVRAPERPYAEEVGRDPGKLRIAWTDDALFGKETDPENQKAVQDAAKMLEGLGHEVVQGCPPFDRDALVRAYFAIVAVGTAQSIANMSDLLGRQLTAADVEAPSWLLAQIAHKLTAAEYEAHRTRIHRASREVAGFFGDVDVLLTPTAARPPVEVGSFALSRAERFQLSALRALDSRRLSIYALETMADDALSATPNTMLFNMTGQPACSLPLHWTPDGLPVGVQAVARFGDEATLFRLASQIEAAHPWADRLPPMLA